MRKNNRPNGIVKAENDYQKLITQSFYEKCPKAVFAALAVSYAVNHGIAELGSITGELLNEWDVLYTNKLVPQKPPKL